MKRCLNINLYQTQGDIIIFRGKMDSVDETLRKARDVEERFKKFLERKVEQDKSIQETFKKIDRTQETLRETRETLGSIDQLYVRLENVLAATIDNAVKSIEKHSLLRIAEVGFVPNKVEAKVVGDMLKSKKRIIVLTGAGVSAASGIPTFRGQNGFWRQDKVEIKTGTTAKKVEPTTILTYKFYSQYPKETWKWLHEFYNIKIKSKPNRGHIALNDILEELARKGKEVSIVTQNIDNFHTETQLQGKKTNKNYKGYPIYQIHGNIMKIRCDKCCFEDKSLISHPYQKYIDLVQSKDKVQCPKCEDSLRPHIMFFDEVYTETINRCDTIRALLKDVDALLIIGTALETGLANQIAQTAYEEEKQIVEINTTCEIKRSKVWWMECKAEVALEEIKLHVFKK